MADSLAMLEEESDEDMREMLKEELSLAKKRIEELAYSVGLQEDLKSALFRLFGRDAAQAWHCAGAS